MISQNYKQFSGKASLKIGKKIGTVTILDFASESKPYNIIYKCLCDCGNIVDIKAECRDVSVGIDNTKSKFGDCACSRAVARNSNNHAQFRGYGEIGRTYYNQVKTNANKRNLDFNVSIEFLWDLFLKQNRRCSLSGLELKFGNSKQITASLDRINSSIGYIESNVQWLHKDINNMKQTFDQNQFIEYCKRIVENNRLT